MTTTTHPISLELLQTFCGTDEIRIVLTKPFSDEQWTYASDGRVLVRVPKMGHPANDGSIVNLAAMLANVQEIFSSEIDDGNFMELPKEPEERWGEECECCDGTGKTRNSVCEYCGCVQENIFDTERDCDGCYDGRKFGGLAIDFGTQKLNPVYLLKLAKLPNVRAACAKDLSDLSSNKSAVTFVFDGGDGRLMGMK